MARCEAQHRTDTWPYVKRCSGIVLRMSVPILHRQGREDLYEEMDLCGEDYSNYLSRLTFEEAVVVQYKSYEITKG